MYSTQFNQWEYDAFQRLLILNVWRGDHSTGVIRGQTDGRILHRKSILSSPQFVYSAVSDIIEDHKNFKKPYFLAGHTRHATKGAITLKNAHPFSFPNVVGMHNGTIQTSFKHRNEFETDSEAFYKNLNDYGLKEALEEIQAYDTAYAFVWVDKKERTLNFVKNSKRPLYFTYAFLGSTLMWSSEKQDLEYVLRRKNYTTNSGWRGDKEVTFFTLYDDHLMSVPIGKNPKEKAKMTKLDIEKKKLLHDVHDDSWEYWYSVGYCGSDPYDQDERQPGPRDVRGVGGDTSGVEVRKERRKSSGSGGLPEPTYEELMRVPHEHFDRDGRYIGPDERLSRYFDAVFFGD